MMHITSSRVLRHQQRRRVQVRACSARLGWPLRCRCRCCRRPAGCGRLRPLRRWLLLLLFYSIVLILILKTNEV